MNGSIACSRRPEDIRGVTGNGNTEAVGAPDSFDLDPAFSASFERPVASGSGLWGSGVRKDGEGFSVEDVSQSAAGPPSSVAPFSGGSNFGGSNPASLFSGMQLLSSQQPVVLPQQQGLMQNFPSSLGWQNLATLVGSGGGGGQQQSLGQQSQALMRGLSYGTEQVTSGCLGHLISAEENWIGRSRDAIPACGMASGEESSDGEDLNKEEGSFRGRNEKMSKGEAAGKKFWKRIRGTEKGEGEFNGELSESQKIAVKVRTSKLKHGKPQHRGIASDELLEDSVNAELFASSSDSGSSSDYSDRDKKDGWTKKRRLAGQDSDGNTTWTDESVKFLFETYDAIHQRLYVESNGHVKYQKKWTPILKAMQDKFGKHFSKKQCQSKYWSVRRECADYRNMSAKAARSDPSWNPSIAGRELLKPKFYDVWFEVAGKKETILTIPNLSNVTAVKDGGVLVRGSHESGLNSSWKLGREYGQPTNHKVEDCGIALNEMQRLMQVQLQASEKREEAMKYRAELMMDLLTQHMDHVERRVSISDEGRQPQLYLLERVNVKLEKVLEGFTALNDNLSIVAIKCIQSQSGSIPSPLVQ